MAELQQKFHVKKNGMTDELSVYTTMTEVNGKGIDIKIAGQKGYLAYGSPDNPTASILDCKVQGEIGKVLKTAKPVFGATLRCFDVATEQQISSLKFPCLAGTLLYLNNDNAPQIKGYDFVVMDGIRNLVQTGEEVFDVWYVKQDVPDRTKTSIYDIKIPAPVVLINTYSCTDGYAAFDRTKNITEIKRINTSRVADLSYMLVEKNEITELPQMDTSNVTDMTEFATFCENLRKIPEMDTSKVTSMAWAFSTNPHLTTIPWAIDMSVCTNCEGMFIDTPVTGIKLKNVPRSLDLSYIGTTNYTVLNYID